MNNKNRIIGGVVLLIVLLVLVVWLYFLRTTMQEMPAPVAASVPAQTSVAPSSSPSSDHIPFAPTPHGLPPDEAQKLSEQQVKHQNHVLDLLFLTPIIFYGKVVDQYGASVQGADALMSPAQGLPGVNLTTSDPEYHAASDEHGLFSIRTHGLNLVVNVTKQGYYRTSSSDGNFTYSGEVGQVNAHTNPDDPAIFLLRKAGDTEPLIMIQGNVKIPRDGTPTQMILATGMTYHVDNGDIQVEAWTHDEGIPPNAPRHYDWKCQIAVLGGGLQPRTGGEFDFTAPEDGYQPSDEIDMPANASPWNDQSSKSYFLKLANGTYARIDFTMAAGGDHFFSITSYLNPQPGHRNLEYDPAKQINK